MLLETIKDIINKYFEEKKEVKAVYLYGSVVSGRDNSGSDVDVALLTMPHKDLMESHYTKVRYGNDIARLVGRDVDIVFLQEVGELLAFQILKDGEVIFERDKKANCAVRALKIIQYLDFQFLEKRMQEGMVAAMRRDGLGR